VKYAKLTCHIRYLTNDPRVSSSCARWPAQPRQHGFDEALAHVELMALEDALRRGGVAIELERAGGGLAVAGRADELRESPKYFHDSVAVE
jgi:hypothetical protein